MLSYTKSSQVQISLSRENVWVWWSAETCVKKKELDPSWSVTLCKHWSVSTQTNWSHVYMKIWWRGHSGEITFCYINPIERRSHFVFFVTRSTRMLSMLHAILFSLSLSLSLASSLSLRVPPIHLDVHLHPSAPFLIRKMESAIWK